MHFLHVVCESRAQAGHTAKKDQGAFLLCCGHPAKTHHGTFVFFGARSPGTAHSLTQAGLLGRRGHKAKARHGTLFFLTTLFVRVPTHKGALHRVSLAYSGPSLSSQPSGLVVVPPFFPWHVCFLGCAVSRNRSLTHAGRAVGTPWPPSKTTPWRIFFAARSPGKNRGSARTVPKYYGIRSQTPSWVKQVFGS